MRAETQGNKEFKEIKHKASLLPNAFSSEIVVISCVFSKTRFTFLLSSLGHYLSLQLARPPSSHLWPFKRRAGPLRAWPYLFSFQISPSDCFEVGPLPLKKTNVQSGHPQGGSPARSAAPGKPSNENKTLSLIFLKWSRYLRCASFTAQLVPLFCLYLKTQSGTLSGSGLNFLLKKEIEMLIRASGISGETMRLEHCL